MVEIKNSHSLKRISDDSTIIMEKIGSDIIKELLSENPILKEKHVTFREVSYRIREVKVLQVQMLNNDYVVVEFITLSEKWATQDGRVKDAKYYEELREIYRDPIMEHGDL